ncbi:MAG TPA: IclR family transcriptional regulator, partial [Acidimicrobiales bacterium]|nr:IclR family transcriptional regulator [Acidimicrobiales bacterium]
AHRLTRALCAGGLLTQDPESDRYQLGPLLVVLGRMAEERLGVARALPHLRRLADETGESVNLGIRAGGDVLVVADAASPQPLRFNQASGSRVPVHTSAMGKCLLAASGDVRGAVSSLPRLDPVTPRTITDRRRLQDELETVGRRGWALNDEERNPGVRAVAVPVAHRGRVVAALAVQGPTLRLPDDRLPDLVERLAATAAAVAPVLGAGVG